MKWLILAVLLAGCASEPTPEEPAFILFEATSQGAKERVQELTCFKDGTIDIGATLTSGQLTVQLLDGDGTMVYQRPMRGPDTFERNEVVGGQAGDWTLKLVMNDAFDGNYRIHFAC